MAKKTYDQLVAENAELKKELTEKNKSITAHAKVVSEKDVQIKEQTGVMAELTERLKEKEMEAKVKGTVITHKKVKYQVLGNIRIGNEVIEAKDLGKKEHADKVKKLIEKKSGLLVELKAE